MNAIKHKYMRGVFLAALALGTFGCKDQLQVGNPNAPTLNANVTNEAGLTALSVGVVYNTAFQNAEQPANFGVLGDSFFDLGYSYHELYADMVAADAANNEISVCNQPDWVLLDDGVTKISQTSSSLKLLRNFNTRAATGAGNNILYFQWRTGYDLNNGCNVILGKVDKIPYAGDKPTKEATFRAWAYWWKGYAYALIGNMYYSGLIVDELDASGTASATNGNYVTHDKIIAASNKYYNKADSVLSLVTSTPDYTEVISNLIPAAFQVGHGNPPTVAEWKANIKSMLARNILVNKLAPFVNGNMGSSIATSSTSTMTAQDWTDVITLASAGVGPTDNCFTGRSSTVNSVFSASTGTISAHATGDATGTTYKISERLTQNFGPGDQRLYNFDTLGGIGAGGVPSNDYYSNTFFGSRYSLVNASGNTNLPSGTYQYSNLDVGGYELYIGTSYEETQLMLAEAKIRQGTQAQIDAGVAHINNVRNYMGAGVTDLAPGMTQVAAMKELVKERRVALVFRGLSFYDARRWGWIYDVANGGGSYGNIYMYTDNNSKVHIQRNATFNFNFLDYWDVPADEWVLNPPATGSAPVKNPNFGN